MPHEIERKFLVDTARWRPAGAGVALRQGYLSSLPERTVRVRLEGDAGTLTIKGLTTGVTRVEFEYAIPAADAAALLALCERPLIEKVRHTVVHEGKTWQVDVFHGDNEGLVLAELELASEDEPFAMPPWATEEVSHDPRYYNANLTRAPYRSWRVTARR
ncbi:MAG TPA: CYTH domain-containing protein [Kofleriaceae bacterium]|nr:CYTH domain-containing protein [Kofleriaceae bacterium]